RNEHFGRARDNRILTGGSSTTSSSRNYQSYSTQAIQQAAASFRQSWLNSASRQGSWVNRVHHLHLSNPPRLKVLNQTPYPHDSPMRPGTGNMPQCDPFRDIDDRQAQVLDKRHHSGASQSQASLELRQFSTSQSQASVELRQFSTSQSQSSMELRQNSASQSQASVELRQNSAISASQSQASVELRENASQSQDREELRHSGDSHSENSSDSDVEIVSVSLPNVQTVSFTDNSQTSSKLCQPGTSLGKRSGLSDADSDAKIAQIEDKTDASSFLSDAGDETSISRIFQCDICNLCRTGRDEIRLHLTVSGHATASECIRQSDVATVQSVVSPRCVQRQPVAAQGNPDLEILCPDCAMPVGCRFACGLQYSLEHRTGREMWAARPIVSRKRVAVRANEYTCRGLCCKGIDGGQTILFASSSELHTHWRSHPVCCPMSELFANLPSMKLLLTVACPRCDRLFLARVESGTDQCLASSVGPFVAAITHLTNRHPGGSYNASFLATLFDLNGGRVSQLPPVSFNRDGSDANFKAAARNWELQLARQLSVCLKRVATSRRSPSSRKLRRHISMLRQCQQ
ncbi:hypothetical protein BOX15_Mlig026320g3, partial [Macrostomum lignano]